MEDDDVVFFRVGCMRFAFTLPVAFWRGVWSIAQMQEPPESKTRADFLKGKPPAANYGVNRFERCSGRNDGNRRGTGEKGKRAKNAGSNGARERVHHGEDRGRRRGSRSLNQMHGDMGRNAERAVGVRIGAVRMGVRDLHRTRNHHQQDADRRQEDSPGTFGAEPGTDVTHLG
jgi:hypothetical protein